MGSATSIDINLKIDEFQLVTLARHKYLQKESEILQKLFDCYKNDGSDPPTISSRKLVELNQMAYDVCILHDNSHEDELGRDNMTRIEEICDGLKKYQISVPKSLGEEKLIESKRIETINRSQLVLVCVTKRFEFDISGDLETSTKADYLYTIRHHTPKFMIPIIMEPRMSDSSKWKGKLGALIPRADASVDASFDIKIEGIVERIKQTIVPICDWLSATEGPSTFIPGSSLLVSASAPAIVSSTPSNIAPRAVITAASAPPDNSLALAIGGLAKEVEARTREVERMTRELEVAKRELEGKTRQLLNLREKQKQQQSGSQPQGTSAVGEKGQMGTEGANWVSSSSCSHTLLGHTDSVYCVTVAATGDVFSGSSDQTCRQWRLVSGQGASASFECVRVFSGHKGTVTGLLLAGSDSIILTCSRDGSLKVWSVFDGRCEWTLTGHTNEVRSVIPWSDGGVLSAGYDGFVRRWRGGDWSLLESLPQVDGKLYCLSALSESRVAAGDSTSGKIFVWAVSPSVSAGAPSSLLLSLAGHRRGVYGLAVSQKLLVSVSFDKQMKFWEEGSLALARTVSLPSQACSVLALPDGSVATAHADNRICVWSEANDYGAAVAVLEGHAKSVVCLIVSSDGRLLSGGDDKAVKVWS